MIRNNLSYKLLALAIAMVIWTYVNRFEVTRESQNNANPYISKRLQIPLQIRRIEADCVLVSAPSNVAVIVRGRRDDVLAVKAAKDDVTAFASMNGYHPGTHIVPVVVRLPEEFIGVVERQADPSAVHVTLESKTRKELPIEVRFTDSPPDGYVFADPIITPDKTTIVGASRSVNSAQKLAVFVDSGHIAKSGVAGSFPIAALDESGKRVQGVEISPGKAHLRLDLLEMPSQRTVFVSPETVGLPPFPYRVEKIEVHPNTLVVSGVSTELDDATTIKTEPLQLTNHKQTFTQRVRVLLPEGVHLQREAYVSVTVLIGQNQRSEDISPGEAHDAKAGQQ